MSTLKVQVKPSARQQKIQKTEEGVWLVSLQSPPVDGKANKELIELLAKELGVPRSQIHIKTGETSRHKLVEILTDP